MLSRVLKSTLRTKTLKPVLYYIPRATFARSSTGDVKFYRAIFLQNAASEDGELTPKQFEEIATQFNLGRPLEIFEKFDKDKTGTIDINEFVKMCEWAKEHHF